MSPTSDRESRPPRVARVEVAACSHFSVPEPTATFLPSRESWGAGYTAKVKSMFIISIPTPNLQNNLKIYI